MSSVESGLYDLGWLDQFARGDSSVHRLDPRVKVLTTLVFLVCVVSLSPYDLVGLAPFALYPVVLASESGMPTRELGRRLLVASPFAVLVGAANPFIDRAIVGHLGALAISAGVVSWVSIVARFLLTASAAVVLVGTTGMAGVTLGLERLGLPDLLATQLLLLYRYLFVLAEEVLRVGRARSLRSFGKRGTGVGSYASIIGHLLVRTAARAGRVYTAMLCRGFDGRIRPVNALKMRGADWAFLLGWSGLLLLFRLVNVPILLGSLITGVHL